MGDLEGKRVLVTGGSGLIGSNLLSRLLDEGAVVRATTFRRPPVVNDKRIEYLRLDLSKGEACRQAVQGIEYVFHCAASTSGAAAITATPMIHVTPNVLINTQMLDAAYEAGVEKFLWLGSTVAYPVRDHPVREHELFDGELYEKYFFAGSAKRFTEILCQMYGQKLPRRMATIVLRPSNVYGPHDDFEFATSHVVPALIRKSVERWNPIEVWGTGEDVRDLIYVDDMVEAIILAISNISEYDAINVASGRPHTILEVLQKIIAIDGYTGAQIKFDSSKPTMIPSRLVDTERAERRLKFKAKTTLEHGLEKTISWYRANRSEPL